MEPMSGKAKKVEGRVQEITMMKQGRKESSGSFMIRSMISLGVN